MRTGLNAKLGGTSSSGISPAYVGVALTASSATVPGSASTVFLAPSGAQAITLYAATASGFQISFVNLTSFSISISAGGSTIGAQSTWTLGANQSLTIQDGEHELGKIFELRPVIIGSIYRNIDIYRFSLMDIKLSSVAS